METRIEHDVIGALEIPLPAYWGIHTQRAVANFPFSTTGVHPSILTALAMVKKACCETNKELGYFGESFANAIGSACDDVAAGKLSGQFPVDAMQGGAGTSTNMNINEVIANRALEILGHPKGNYSVLHPIEHVNLHQSTNDVYPTALKIAAINGIRQLNGAITAVQDAMQTKEKEFASIVTMGRTELADAVPMTLGAQFSCFAEAISRDRWRTFKCEERLRIVNIGGTAIGTGLTAPKSYIFLVIEKLRAITGQGLCRAENPMDQTANADAFSEVAGILGAHAANLRKICNDLRLLHSIGDIRLPSVQAGSSIMPGKINPVVCEAVIGVSVKVQALLNIVNETSAMGTLQINEFLPLLGQSLMEAIGLLCNANLILAAHAANISADEQACLRHVNQSATIITAFLPHIGYDKAECLVKEFEKSNEPLFRTFLENNLGKKLVDTVLSPQSLMSLGHHGKPLPIRK